MNPTARTAGNTFKTFALMGALTALLLVIGQLVGGGTGLMFFAIIAIGFNFFAYWFSGPMALKMSRAQEVSEQQAPELHHMVATLSARAGIPKPKTSISGTR